MDKIKYLKDNFVLFNGLSNVEIEHLLDGCDVCEYKYSPGEIIQSKATDSRIGIITKGRAVIRSGVNGVIINKIGKNDIFGVASLFDTPSHFTTIHAVTDCYVIGFDKDFIEYCIKNSPSFSLNYIELLSRKISFLNEKINAYTAKSAESKLYAYLLLLPRHGNTVELQSDMSTIAKMIGIGRATLYRSFEKLISSGTITKIDKNIILNEV